jgi:hypothetical protein
MVTSSVSAGHHDARPDLPYGKRLAAPQPSHPCQADERVRWSTRRCAYVDRRAGGDQRADLALVEVAAGDDPRLGHAGVVEQGARGARARTSP